MAETGQIPGWQLSDEELAAAIGASEKAMRAAYPRHPGLVAEAHRPGLGAAEADVPRCLDPRRPDEVLRRIRLRHRTSRRRPVRATGQTGPAGSARQPGSPYGGGAAG